jgi:hypothetical protein
MDTIELWARNGDAVREAIELGDLVHLDTASEELKYHPQSGGVEDALQRRALCEITP